MQLLGAAFGSVAATLFVSAMTMSAMAGQLV
jgi:hypothetical protein